MHVLIVGCGYVGTALGRRLSDAGHDVTGLRRDPSGLPDAIRPLAVDLADQASLAAGMADLASVDAVAVTISAGGRDAARYRAAYVEAPRRLLRNLARRGDPVQRALFTSSSAVWGGEGGVRVDEATPTSPTSPTGRVLVEAERAIAAGPFPATVLRLTGIYGPGRTRLVDQVREGRATYPAEPDHTNRIHRDDAAAALSHVLDLPEAPPVLAVTDDDAATRRVVLEWLADRLDAPRPQVEGQRPRRGSKQVSNARLRDTGWAPMFPSFREGYAAMIGPGGDDDG